MPVLSMKLGVHGPSHLGTVEAMNPAGCPRSFAVQFHDILYTLSLDILYTSARV